MADESRNERDLVLAPNEYALISDATKGNIDVYVGPHKTSLANTDRCVLFDSKTKRFRQTDFANGVQLFQTAPEGYYVVLKNVAEGGKHPSGSGKLTNPPLQIGKKVNISGPASFALWPGQMAKVIQGHNLRSNEYLLVRVYDEEAARANWSKAVIKTQTSSDTASEDVSLATMSKTQRAASHASIKSNLDIPSEKDLSMGKLFVIKGTDVSFYIPSTGLEVVPEKVNGEERYVREAVTLERLEYCLLLDQNGSKRYVHGPDVVFPRPTEKFVEAPIKSDPDKVKAKKFRAQELTPASGIHVRVIADYQDGNVEHKAGEELFITGAEQTIYFPREEHAIIKYGNQELHYGIAIPEGEARYVLDRDSGVISLVKGPQVFLPDPRKQVIINRALDLKLCELLYPGNQDALDVNAQRLGITDQDISAGGGGDQLGDLIGRGYESYAATTAVASADTTRRVMIKGASKSLPGDAFDRKNKFTAPRSIVLNTKFDGAVSTTIWTGYSMLLVRKNGDRRVVQGPGTFMLEYDEAPQVLTLSRGKPKTMDQPLRTVFLLTKANKVSDVIDVETNDFCRLQVKLSYRVNFEGDSNAWFNVDNYVKFLCDHMRSRVRAAVQKLGIEQFYGNHTDIVRDVVLGKSTPHEGRSSRPGTSFEENGMKIYDVEVLGVTMQNQDVEKMLIQAQRDVITNTLMLATEKRKLGYVKEREIIAQESERAHAETVRQNLEVKTDEARQRLAYDLTVLDSAAKTAEATTAQELVEQQAQATIAEIARTIESAQKILELQHMEATQAIKLKQLDAEVQAVVQKAAAIAPGLIEALNSFGERSMVEKVAAAMAPLSILGGDSAVDVLRKMLEGTHLAKQLAGVVPNGASNGEASSTARAPRARS